MRRTFYQLSPVRPALRLIFIAKACPHLPTPGLEARRFPFARQVDLCDTMTGYALSLNLNSAFSRKEPRSPRGPGMYATI